MSHEPRFESPHRLRAEELEWIREQLRRRRIVTDPSGVIAASEGPGGTHLEVSLPPQAVLFKVTGSAVSGVYPGKIMVIANDGASLEEGPEGKAKIAS